MGRKILAVIVGYIIMAVIIIGGLYGAYAVMGADKAFKPGGFDITLTWLISMEAIGLIGAIIGGITCAKISKNSKGAVLSLFALIIVLAGVNIALIAMADPPTPEQTIRTETTTANEARVNAQLNMPIWVAALDPIVGVVGVMIGAMLVCPGRCDPKGPGSAGD